jgi:phage gp36-like protein
MEPKYAGDTVSKKFYFYNELDALIDPNDITGTLYTPAAVAALYFTLANFVKVTIGIYTLTFNVPASAAVGEWRLVVVPTRSTGTIQETEAYVFEVSSLAQPYGSLERVKRLCGLANTTANDQDLNDALIDVDRLINSRLEAHDVTIPLTAVPGILHTVAEYMAAGSYLQNTSPDEKPHPYTEKGEKLLAAYILGKYTTESTESPFYIGTDTS